MSQSNSNSRIVKSYSLLAFAKEKGPRMQIGNFTNSESGEEFKSCIFTDADDNHTFVAFSSKLGELSPMEIKQQKNELQVVELETEGYETHHFSLCRQGENTWQEVDLWS